MNKTKNISSLFFLVGCLVWQSHALGADLDTVLLIHSNEPDGSTTFTDSSDWSHEIVARGDIVHVADDPPFLNSAIYFDGNGSYLELADSDDWFLDDGDWTIDFWIKPDDGVPRALISQSENANNTPYFIVTLGSGALNYYHEYTHYYSETQKTQFHCSCSSDNCPCRNSEQCQGNQEGGSHPDKSCVHTTEKVVQKSKTYSENFSSAPQAITAGQWQHIAIIRDGDVIVMYVDGVFMGSQNVSVVYDQSAPLFIGHDGVHSDFKGYLAELRFSKGVARWTTEFTPPESAYDAVSIDFWADKNMADYGEEVVLTWNSENSTSCTIEPEVGDVDLNGSVSVYPTSTTTYFYFVNR